MFSSQQAIDLPLRLGKLELGEVLSSTFFGARYRARLAEASRSGMHALGTAALQTSPSSAELCTARIVLTDAPDVMERLARAATAVCGPVHPALLEPLQIMRERGRLAIVTSDTAGMTLTELAERVAKRGEGLPQDIALRIVLDLLAGLHALELVVHETARDACLYGGLTPESVHVGRDGQTRLLDPGVMAAAARESVWADERRMLAYSAPELHTESPRYDARTDTFAIGIVLWELLSCRALFAAPSAFETIEAVCDSRIARVRRERFVRGEPITAAVANVVARALNRDPAQRFQTYGELAAALRDAAPVAEAEQVAAFVAAENAPAHVPAFDTSERVTARLPQLGRAEESSGARVDATVPTTTDAKALDAPQSTERSLAIEVEPVDALPEATRIERAAPSPQSAASAQRRGVVWAACALGAALFAILAVLALKGSERTADHAASAHPTSHATRAVQTRPEAGAAPRSLAPVNPLGASEPPPLRPTVAERPIARAPVAQPLPTANAPAPALAPSKPRARPAFHRKAAKRPFIPDDI